MQTFLTMQLPEKVRAMHEGVIALMNEGIDIHTMKVEDITKKAGIGKGTAYEYFKSKEEIIIQALIYDANKQLYELYLRQQEREPFEAKMRIIFEWLREKFQNSLVCQQRIQLWMGCYEVSHLIRDRFLQLQQDTKGYKEFIDYLLTTGIEQGVIHPQSLYQGHTALVSQLINYIMYLSNRSMYPEITVDEAMETAYGNMMTLLKA